MSNTIPGVPIPNTTARIEHGIVSERVTVKAVSWGSGKAADGVAAVVERPQPEIGEPAFAAVVFWPSVPRVTDGMYHTKDIRGWFEDWKSAACAMSDIRRELFPWDHETDTPTYPRQGDGGRGLVCQHLSID